MSSEDQREHADADRTETDEQPAKRHAERCRAERALASDLGAAATNSSTAEGSSDHKHAAAEEERGGDAPPRAAPGHGGVHPAGRGEERRNAERYASKTHERLSSRAYRPHTAMLRTAGGTARGVQRRIC